jgi:hypothetical protein
MGLMVYGFDGLMVYGFDGCGKPVKLIKPPELFDHNFQSACC